MKKYRLTIMIGLLVAVVLLIAGGCARTTEQRAEYFVQKMASELNLNDVQKAKLEQIKDEFLAKRPEMANHRAEAIKAANELMRSAEIDKAKLNALNEDHKKMADEVIAFISAKFVEIHDMLTPEQREKLVTHIEKYREHGHH
jgi:periplasmic protein CpxP/Spy